LERLFSDVAVYSETVTTEQQIPTLSGGLASVANAMPGAIGAQLAYPDSQVFALAGDGAFAMLMGDFVTAVKYRLPIVVVVFNNSKLAFITLEQVASGIPDWGTDLLNPDFAAFAEACGGCGCRVEKVDEIEPALLEAIAADRPALIDVKVDPDALIMPPNMQLSRAFNFGKAKLRELFLS